MFGENGIFSHPGRKIKRLMKFLFGFLLFASVLGALAVLVIFLEEDPLIALLSGVGILIFGPILAFLLTLPGYALGELVENSTLIKNQLTFSPSGSSNNSFTQ